MKQALFILLFTIPILTHAQQKESWWKRARERAKQENEEYKKPVAFNSIFDQAGYDIQKGSSLFIDGIACEIIGGGVLAVGSSQSDGDNIAITGGAVAVAGLVLQLVGLSKIGKGGKELRSVKFTGNSVSFVF